MAQFRFVHIINPVGANENAELFTAQEFTFQTTVAAKKYALEKGINVQHLAVFTPGNHCALPNEYTVLPELKRTSADMVKTSKKLPVFKDVLEKLHEHSDADYLIYSNLDICLMPNFYVAVEGLIQEGHDAIIINRRVVSSEHFTKKNLDLMYSELGDIHSGYDMFIFKKSLFTKFILKDIFIGVPPIGSDLFYNFFVFAENPVLKTQEHLTFHIGKDLIKPWGDAATWKHNHGLYKQFLKEIKPKINIEKFPAANRNFFVRHFKWLMNPTVSYPVMASVDFKQLFRKRKPRKKKEIPGIYQRYLEWLSKKIKLD